MPRRSPSGNRPETPNDTRAERLAAALRANLARRKAQAAARRKAAAPRDQNKD